MPDTIDLMVRMGWRPPEGDGTTGTGNVSPPSLWCWRTSGKTALNLSRGLLELPLGGTTAPVGFPLGAPLQAEGHENIATEFTRIVQMIGSTANVVDLAFAISWDSNTNHRAKQQWIYAYHGVDIPRKTAKHPELDFRTRLHHYYEERGKMTTFIQVHTLQTFPACNLNRGDDGRPKTLVYGGVERIRYSSQALKYALRNSPVLRETLGDVFGKRTKLLGREFANIFWRRTLPARRPQRSELRSRRFAARPTTRTAAG